MVSSITLKTRSETISKILLKHCVLDLLIAKQALSTMSWMFLLKTSKRLPIDHVLNSLSFSIHLLISKQRKTILGKRMKVSFHMTLSNYWIKSLIDSRKARRLNKSRAMMMRIKMTLPKRMKTCRLNRNVSWQALFNWLEKSLQLLIKKSLIRLLFSKIWSVRFSKSSSLLLTSKLLALMG